jgi:hypothetical protein
MTRRDLCWRAAGVGLLTLGCALARAVGADGGTAPLGLAGFVLAVLGLVLAVQGRRVVRALRIERSAHRDLPRSLHARHLRRRRS